MEYNNILNIISSRRPFFHSQCPQTPSRILTSLNTSPHINHPISALCYRAKSIWASFYQKYNSKESKYKNVPAKSLYTEVTKQEDTVWFGIQDLGWYLAFPWQAFISAWLKDILVFFASSCSVKYELCRTGLEFQGISQGISRKSKARLECFFSIRNFIFVKSVRA